MINKDIIDKVKYFNFPALSSEVIKNLISKLNVNFSKEFLDLAKVANFEYFDCFPINNLDLEADCSVIGDTLRLRNSSSLPQNTLFLWEDDASVLLMKCLGDREEIYWIAVEDFENFCEEKPLLYEPTIFLTFPDFFEYLAKEEEKMSASGNKQ